MPSISISAYSRSAKWRLSGLLLLVILAVEIYFLVHDIPLADTNHGRPVERLGPMIAEIVKKTNSVRVQAPGDIVWENAISGQILRRSESVLTLERSKAEIAFLDGAGLVIEENSLVQIERNDAASGGRTVITLLRGAIRKKQSSGGARREAKPSTEALVIRAGNANAEVGPTAEVTVALTPEAATAAKILVHSGEAKVQSSGGEIRATQGDEVSVASVASSAPPVPRKAAFILSSPADGETIRANGIVPVSFSGTVDPAQTGETPLQIEVSPDPLFVTRVKTVTIAAASPPLQRFEAKLQLQANATDPWYWRVKTLRDQRLSAVSKFMLQPEPVPKPLIPLPSTQVAMDSDVDLAWSFESGTPEQPLSYEIRFRQPDGPDSKERIITAPTRSARTGRLASGEYLWQVRAHFKNGSVSPWSTERSFIVQAASKAAEAPPTVPAPEEKRSPPPPPGQLMEPEIIPEGQQTGKRPRSLPHAWVEWIISPAWAQQPARTYNMRLRWQEVPGVKKYKIQVGRQKSFANILAEAETSEPTWTWKYRPGMENSKGRAFYRVASIDDQGVVGEFSEPKAIQIPESILARNKPPQKASKPERYSAVDQDEVAQALPAKAPISAPTPTPTSVPVLASVQHAAPKTVLNAPSPEVPLRRGWFIQGAIAGGIAKTTQKSGEPDLRSISISPYVRQRVSAAAGFSTQREWIALLEADLASFQNAALPKEKALAIRLDLLNRANSAERWQFGLGARVDRSYRWMKTAALDVSAHGAFSLGPVAHLVRNFDEKGFALRPVTTGVSLAVPFSGLATKGYFATEGKLWGEWSLVRIGSQRIRARIEADVAFARWSQPKDTSVTDWSICFAPTWRFDSL